MKLEQFLSYFEKEELSHYQSIYKAAKTSDKNRGGVSKEILSLFEKVLLRAPLGKPSGYFLGQFWKQFSSEDKKKKARTRIQDDFEELKRIAKMLPYPLGDKFRDFLLESKRFEKGVGCSNFAYQMSALHSMALRFLAVVAVSEYVECQSSTDPSYNQSIVDSLWHPSDGTWKSLLERLVGLHEANEQLFLLKLLHKHLRKKYSFSGAKKGILPLNAMQELIQFRNQLMHGTHTFRDEELHRYVELLKIVFCAMSFLGEFHLLVRYGDGVYDCSGKIPSFFQSDKLPNAISSSCEFLERHPLTHPVLIPKRERKTIENIISSDWKGLSLFPLLYFVRSCEEAQILDELMFFNGWSKEEIEFVSFRFARNQEHRKLGFDYGHFLSFLRMLPSINLSSEVLLDFSGLVDFHLTSFVGRKQITGKMIEFAQQRPAPYGVIKAIAGMGKTALFSYLYKLHQKGSKAFQDIFPIWHFCSSSEGWDHPVVFLRSVLFQLDSIIGKPRREYPTSTKVLRKQFASGLQDLSQKLTCEQKVVFFIDALDEGLSDDSRGLSIPALLPSAESIPPNVSFLVSYRVEQNNRNLQLEKQWTIRTPFVHTIEGCEPLGGLDKVDMAALLKKVSGIDEIPEETLRSIWNTSIQRNDLPEGTADPLVLRLIGESLGDGILDPLRSETVPESLDALFDQFWNGLSNEENYLLHRLLGMLAIMPDLGNDNMFAKIFSRDVLSEKRFVAPDEVAQRRLKINKFLVFSGERYKLFHARFRVYVLRRFRPYDHVHYLHKPLLSYCNSDFVDKNRYDLSYKVFHLKKLAVHEGCTPEERDIYKWQLWDLLWDDAFFLEKFEVFQRMDLVREDFLRSFEVFAPRGEHEVTWSQWAKSYQLSLRTHFLLSKMMEESRKRIRTFAMKGDQEQVIRIALWGGTPYRRLWQLLLGAVWSVKAGFPAEKIFHVMSELELDTLQSDEYSMALHLLKKARGSREMELWLESKLQMGEG